MRKLRHNCRTKPLFLKGHAGRAVFKVENKNCQKGKLMVG